MGRELGTSRFAGAYVVYSTTALDPRLVVDTYEDLKKESTWPTENGVVFVYNGMQVAILDTQDTYMLVDSAKYNTDAGWRKQNTGSELLCNKIEVNGPLTVTSEQSSIFNAPVIFNRKTTHNNGIHVKSGTYTAAIESEGDIIPSFPETYKLGSLSNIWNYIYSKNGAFFGNLSINNGYLCGPDNKVMLNDNNGNLKIGEGYGDNVIWFAGREYKFNIPGTTQPQVGVMISKDGRLGIGNVGGAPAEKLHVADGYVIANGYKLWTQGVATATEPGYAVMTNGGYMKISTINSSFSGTLGTTNETDSKVNVASTKHTHSGTASASGGKITVAAKDHTHTISATEESTGHTHTFSGTAVTSGDSSSNVSVVDKDHTHSGTTNGPSNGQTTSVAAKDHTHTISDIPTTVASSFTGTNKSTEKTTFTVTYNASILDLSISTSHSHNYTPAGTVASNITATKTVTSSKESGIASVPNISHTHGFTTNASTQNPVLVAKGDHTHNVTAKGTIESTKVSVIGNSVATAGTTDVSSTGHTHSVTVNASDATITDNYTLVAKADHKHTYTPAGSITSEFEK